MQIGSLLGECPILFINLFGYLVLLLGLSQHGITASRVTFLDANPRWLRYPFYLFLSIYVYFHHHVARRLHLRFVCRATGNTPRPAKDKLDV
ncbi:hypothetical protein V8E52_000905 [Russula decolorans]